MSKDDHNHVAMVDSIICRRDEWVEYEAPGAEQKWRARNLVDIHWELTGIKCPASHNRVMACIIDHANPTNGVCNPRQEIISIETGYSIDTVQRAIGWWKKQKFLTTTERGLGHALAYHPKWDLFELYYTGCVAEIETLKESSRTKGRYANRTKGRYDEPQHGAVHNLKEITSKEEPHPEWTHPPSASDVNSEGTTEKGIQGEQVGTPSPQPQSPVGPLSFEEAEQAVMAAMGRFEYSHHTEESYRSCIEAEMAVPGSGVAAVKAIAAEAWQKKRKQAK